MSTHRHLATATLAAIGLWVSTSASALPLNSGDIVRVGDASGSVFTPAPVLGDTNGLFTNVRFSLNGGASVTASAGLFVLDYQHVAPTATTMWTQFLAFCLEPDVYLTPFSNPYTVNTVGATRYNSALISELWGRYRSSVVDDTTAAAFQVSLWEVVFGTTDLNVATGAFRLTSSLSTVGALAQQWVSSLTGQGAMAQGLRVLVNNPNSANRQDLLTQGAVSVPEPATLMLMGLGLVIIGFGLGQGGRRTARSRA